MRCQLTLRTGALALRRTAVCNVAVPGMALCAAYGEADARKSGNSPYTRPNSVLRLRSILTFYGVRYRFTPTSAIARAQASASTARSALGLISIALRILKQSFFKTPLRELFAPPSCAFFPRRLLRRLSFLFPFGDRGRSCRLIGHSLVCSIRT